jgi:predicted ribosomally synthesized peptide with SipW-like signal peptide
VPPAQTPAPRRHALLSVIVLGAIVTLVGGTGIFAVFTDRATTGLNSVTSGERARAADIQLAIAVPDINGGYACSAFADDLANPFFTMTDAQPGDGATRMACVQNVGSATVLVSLTSADLLESDASCTGDEESLDASCGQGDGFGQLAAALSVSVEPQNCFTAQAVGVNQTAGLATIAATPIVLLDNGLAPGATACFLVALDYPTGTPEETAQVAQSDGVVWRFAFDASTAE